MKKLPEYSWWRALKCWILGHTKAKNFYEGTGGEYCFWCFRRWPAKPAGGR